MTFLELSASQNDNDRRLDRVVRKFIAAQSLSGIYSAIRKGLIRLNEKKASPETHVFSGDNIKIADFLISNNTADLLRKGGNNGDTAKTNETMREKNFPYKIVFQNENALVLNKPRGISVHGKENSLEKEVLRLFKATSKDASLSFTPGPLHRLDKHTSGLVVFSWSIEGARWFSNALLHHKIHKTYLGIAYGILTEEERWEDFILKDNKNEDALHGNFHTVFASSCKESDSSKTAITIATPLEYGNYKGNPVTLIRYKIETGRTHQIRAQSALHNLPLAGDTAYGAENIPFPAFFLHAQKLEIPNKNEIALPPVLQTEIPREFKKFLKMCGMEFN